jgi:tRNA 2-thiouridine synthesizing protein A
MAMKFEKKGEGLYYLDVLGYVCPHPQIYAKKALEKIAKGDVLEMVFDNPSSAESVGAMCEANGIEIIEKKKEGSTFAWKIKKP